LTSEILKSPWDYLQGWDTKLCGQDILDPAEQTRWSRAMFLGGLPYMWRKIEVVRQLMYDRLDLRPGDRVLLLGESIVPCGFVDDIRRRIGPTGEVEVIDILEDARQAYFTGQRGAGGQLATWRFNYTDKLPDESFDCVAVLQAIQHTDDWTATGKELLRIMKSGRHILLAEIAFGHPAFMEKVRSDIHIEYLWEKIFSRMGWALEDAPYYSPDDLLKAFNGLVIEPRTFEWRGLELFWGAKP